MKVTLIPCEGVVPRCAICHDDSLDDVLLCPECRTLVHAECRVGVACPTLGCAHGSRRHPRRAQVRRVPPPGVDAGSWLSTLTCWLLIGGAGWLGLGWLTTPTMAQGPRARLERARADMRSIGQALDLYKIDTGEYPEQLKSLWERPVDVRCWNGPYLQEYPPRDPWGGDYGYVRSSPTFYEILSDGADGARGCSCADADHSSHTINRQDAQ
jgi:general secretion pathway protein G